MSAVPTLYWELVVSASRPGPIGRRKCVNAREKAKVSMVTAGELKRTAQGVELLSVELDRQRASYVQRKTAMNSRAAIMVGAASIATGLADTKELIWLQLGAYLFLSTAAVCGIYVLWPRTGDEPTVGSYRDSLYTYRKHQLQLELLDQKLDAHEKDEKSLVQAARWTAVGFSCLALATILIGIQAVARQY